MHTYPDPLQNDSLDVIYKANLYELHNRNDEAAASVYPNWFGVAIPNPLEFDLSSTVYVVICFSPTLNQGGGYDNRDYPEKTGNYGRDWKHLFGYVDRLGTQTAGAVKYGAPANRVVIFPFMNNPLGTKLEQLGYTKLPIEEWFNVILDHVNY